ncbi:MAG: DUF1778 domain-containing protein [Pseudanabaena sp.]|jgi:hypothetical protein
MNSQNSNPEEIQCFKLSLEESKIFINSLLNAPKPNEALTKAALRHKQFLCSNGSAS